MHATLLRVIYIAKETKNNKLLSSSIFCLTLCRSVTLNPNIWESVVVMWLMWDLFKRKNNFRKAFPGEDSAASSSCLSLTFSQVQVLTLLVTWCSSVTVSMVSPFSLSCCSDVRSLQQPDDSTQIWVLLRRWLLVVLSLLQAAWDKPLSGGRAHQSRSETHWTLLHLVLHMGRLWWAMNKNVVT